MSTLTTTGRWSSNLTVPIPDIGLGTMRAAKVAGDDAWSRPTGDPPTIRIDTESMSNAAPPDCG